MRTPYKIAVLISVVYVLLHVALGCGKPLPPELEHTSREACHKRGFKYAYAKHQGFCLEKRPDGLYNAIVLPGDVR